MNNTFKINKEEIVKRLSQIDGVRAIRVSVPDEVPNEYEGSIKVLYEFQDGEDTSLVNKSIELKNRMGCILKPENMDIYIAVRAVDNPRFFYGKDYRLKGSEEITEVVRNDRYML